MVSKQFTDRGDVERTIKENPLWQNLSKDERCSRLKDMLTKHRSLTDDAKEYIRQQIQDLEASSK